MSITPQSSSVHDSFSLKDLSNSLNSTFESDKGFDNTNFSTKGDQGSNSPEHDSTHSTIIAGSLAVTDVLLEEKYDTDGASSFSEPSDNESPNHFKVNDEKNDGEASNLENKENEDPQLKDKDEEHSSEIIRGKPSACVFVASLCSTTDDDALCISVTDHFKKWGKLSTVKVLRDTSNRPYAFVQYTNDQDCQKAIRFGHDSLLGGRRLRCEAAKVNRTLFITSLRPLSESELRQALDEFGELDSVRASDTNGLLKNESYHEFKFKNWFVKFTYRDDAIRAFANFTETNLLSVEWAKNIDDRPQRSMKLITGSYGFDKFSIFIGQLNPTITDDELLSHFKLHGDIREYSIIRRQNSTFAFITFEKESSAAGAVERENHAMLKNKTIHVQYREVHPAPKKQENSSNVGFTHAPPPINLLKRAGYLKPLNATYSNNLNVNHGYVSNSSPRSHSTIYNYHKEKGSSTPTRKPLRAYPNNFNNDRSKPFRSNSRYNNPPNIFSQSKAKDFIGIGNDNRKAHNIYNDLGSDKHNIANKNSPPPSNSTLKSQNGTAESLSAATKGSSIVTTNPSYYYYVPSNKYDYNAKSGKKNVSSNYYCSYPYYPYGDQKNYVYSEYYQNENENENL